MKTPSLFVHYWTENQILTPFQDVMNWDINPTILEIIQTEIINQLNSDSIQMILPNFNWGSTRFTEKWESMAQTLLLQVALPEKIWLDWIHDLTNKTLATKEEVQAYNLEEIYPNFEELLNAEVYYSSPADSLDDIIEDTLQNKPIEIPDNELLNALGNNSVLIENEINHSPELTSEKEEQPLDDILMKKKIEKQLDHATENDSEENQFVEKPTENSTIELSIFKVEIGATQPLEKKVLDILGESSERKVFESLQSEQDNSLKNKIHTEMTSSLAETLPLFQKINFIQNLFDGESEHLEEIIQFIDHQANKASDWKLNLQSKYATFQKEDKQELWTELYLLIERKFS